MSISLQQPQAYDLVGNKIHIGGVAGGAFEAQFSYRIHEGHDEVTGGFMAGDGVGGHGQFHVAVKVKTAAFKLSRLFVDVFHESAKDGSPLDLVSVPVVLGRLVVPGYRVYDEYVVEAGDTLWGIAQDRYGDGNLYHRLVSANPHTIPDPDVISVGQVIRVPRA